MQLTRFLDAALSSPGAVRLLRSLVLDEKPRSGRALARDVGLSHARARIVLQDLHELGILSFTAVGRSHVYSLRREVFPVSQLLIPLFKNEGELTGQLAATIVGAIKTPILGSFLFGSVSRGEDHPESDLDLALIVKSKADQALLEEEVAGSVAEEASRLGVTLEALVYTRTEFRKRYQDRDRFIREITRTSRHVSGRTWMDFVTVDL